MQNARLRTGRTISRDITRGTGLAIELVSVDASDPNAMSETSAVRL